MRPFALAGLLAAACAMTPTSRLHEDAESLAAAETAFAAHSVREDMRAAFLANFGNDGVMAREGWVLAKPYLEPRPAPPVVLDWHPAHVEVAGSGEMGLSTGPWKLTPDMKPVPPSAYGQFCSVWRRDADGAWKVLVDLGISNPQPTFWRGALDIFDTPASAPPRAGGVDAAERAFAQLARGAGARAAYARYGAARLRFYREGFDPIVGRDAALASPAMAEAAWVVERAESSRSGDFAYARGRVVAPSNPATTLGYFLRVWRAEEGALRIVLDVVQPAS